MAIAPIATLGEALLDAVESDNPTHEYEVTDKAVEEGVSISDHIKAQPVMLSISGIVVGEDAWQRLQRIRQYQEKGELVTYTNRVIYYEMAITSISTSHSVSVANGFSFEIQMKRVRIAAPQEIQITNVPAAVQTKVKEVKNAGTKQTIKTDKKTETKKDTGTKQKSNASGSKSSNEKLADKIRNFTSQ